MLASASFFNTLATAISKSSWVTWTLLSPQSEHSRFRADSLHFGTTGAIQLFGYAGEIEGRESDSILFEWIFKISRRAAVLGRNSILRSIRPGRNKAGSNISIRLVAMITLIAFCILETVKLIQQLQHCTLNFGITTTSATSFSTSRSNWIDFINENNWRACSRPLQIILLPCGTLHQCIFEQVHYRIPWWNDNQCDGLQHELKASFPVPGGP